MNIFDAQCGVGGRSPGSVATVTADDLRGDMKRAGVQRALVRIEPTQLAFDIPAVNADLFDMCTPHDELIPCPVVAPNGAGDLANESEQVHAAIRAGAGAVFVRPNSDKWSPARWGCAELLEALAACRMPAFCHVDELPLDAIAAWAGDYPQMPIILAGVGYREHRVVAPLLRAFSNIHMVVGATYIVFQGIESCLETASVDQLLLGTGYARFDLYPAIGYVMYAEIADEKRALIAGGNLQRLVEGIQR